MTRVTTVRFGARFWADITRLEAFLQPEYPLQAADLYERLLSSFRLLKAHPRIGRPVHNPNGPPLRELLIDQGRSGYLALYNYEPLSDTVNILRVRHQREQDYH